MTEHIELTEEQKEYIKKRFISGEELFDKVITFDERDSLISLQILIDQYAGITPDIFSYGNEIIWLHTFPDKLIIDFHKEVIGNEI